MTEATPGRRRSRTPPDPAGWVLISVSAPGAAGSLRVYVWRKLRSLGALYLQSSVCLLPARPAVIREVHRLVDRVHRDGGTTRVMHLVIPDPDQEHGLREELNTARDGEYAEILERTPAFLAELGDERAKGRVSYVEVEESEADLDRFRAWLAKIEARDYFGASGGDRARAAVDACQRELTAFEAEAVAAEAPPTRAGHLRGLPARPPAAAADEAGSA